MPGAAVLVTEEWQYPEDDTDPDDPSVDPGDETSEEDVGDEDERKYVDPVKVYVPAWVVPDTEPAQQAGFTVPVRPTYGVGAANGTASGTGTESEEQAEARREERRRVIANNKA